MHWDSGMLLYVYVQALCGWTAEIPALGNVSERPLRNRIGRKELIKKAEKKKKKSCRPPPLINLLSTPGGGCENMKRACRRCWK